MKRAVVAVIIFAPLVGTIFACHFHATRTALRLGGLDVELSRIEILLLSLTSLISEHRGLMSLLAVGVSIAVASFIDFGLVRRGKNSTNNPTTQQSR